MTDNLPPMLPCPFCGSTNLITEHARDFIACADCSAEGPFSGGMGSTESIEAWNQRAAPAAQDLAKTVTRLMHIACESGVAEGRHRVEWLALVEHTRELLAAPAAQVPQEPDMRHPKIQALIGSKARLSIILSLVDQLLDEGPDTETSSLDMEYWDSTHDKLQAVLRAAQQAVAQEPRPTTAEPVACPTWQDAERIRDFQNVDAAIRALLDDQTGDNATGAVLAVLQAWRAESCATPQAQAPRVPLTDEREQLLAWAVASWHAEVSQRPLVNKNRRTLDDTWRQVIRFAGADPNTLIGPDHDTLLAGIGTQEQP